MELDDETLAALGHPDVWGESILRDRTDARNAERMRETYRLDHAYRAKANKRSASWKAWKRANDPAFRALDNARRAERKRQNREVESAKRKARREAQYAADPAAKERILAAKRAAYAQHYAANKERILAAKKDPARRAREAELNRQRYAANREAINARRKELRELKKGKAT